MKTIAILFLALLLHGQAWALTIATGSAEGTYFQIAQDIKKITEREGIPRRYLEPVLQELVHQKILVGIRGPSGGYRLARERRQISLGDIVRIVRGLETGEDPITAPAGSALGHRVVRHPLSRWGR